MGTPRFLFIRDDDVYISDRVFLKTFSLFKDARIPVIYGVIPGKIDSTTVRFLKQQKRKNPSLLDIVQHGWLHKDYNLRKTAPDDKYEFGVSRSQAQQKSDIVHGYKKMRRLFGRLFTPAFIPPYHGYDLTTLKIISSQRIPLFSAGEKTAVHVTPYLDLPAQISLNDYSTTGTPLPLDSRSMIKRVLAGIQMRTRIIGAVFHHRALGRPAALAEMKRFAAFIKKIDRQMLRVILFSELLKIRPS